MKLFRPDRPANSLHRTEALACIPVISPSVDWNQQEDGDILISYPFVISPLLHSIFKRFNRGSTEQPRKKLQLDEMGSEVWTSFDGEKNVRQIIEEFSENRGVTLRESELAVTAFLRDLGKRGLIILK